MACSCGKKNRNWSLTTPNGQVLFYNTETEAAAAQRRQGGTVTPPKS